MKRKRTAVVGAGWFGQAHIRNFYEVSNLVGICDIFQHRLKSLPEQYKKINTYLTPDEMIKNEDLDAVSVVTPPKYIPEISKKFAGEGIDILMEKPMALSLEELLTFKKYENLRIMPGFIELYNPVFEKLLYHIPEVGEIISIASKRVGLYPKRDWQMGVILDLSIHDIYLQEKVINRGLVDVTGIKKCYKDGVHSDAAFINLDFGDVIGHIESNWLTPSKFRRMYVNGDSGSIRIDFISQQIDIRTGIGLKDEQPLTKEVIYSPLKMDEPLKREILSFLYDKEPKVNLDDGIRVLEIALKIVNS